MEDKQNVDHNGCNKVYRRAKAKSRETSESRHGHYCTNRNRPPKSFANGTVI